VRLSNPTRAGILGTTAVVAAVLVLVSVTSANKALTKATHSGRLGMQPAPVGVVKAIAHVSPSAFAEAGAAITRSAPYTGLITVLESQPALTQ